PEVVEDDVQRVAPPRVPPRPEIVQDDPEVQPDLDPDLTLARVRRAGRIALGSVRGGDEQIAQGADVPVEQTPDSRELEIRRVDLVGGGAALSRRGEALAAAGAAEQ